MDESLETRALSPSGFYEAIHAGMNDAVEVPTGNETRACGKYLSDLPDWLYLLHEYYAFYRDLSAGGSPVIRAHQRAVRTAVRSLIKANSPVRCVEAAQRPVTGHLRRALDQGRLERHASMIRALEAVQCDLRWEIGYRKPPPGLERKFAYAEIAGPSGPVQAENVIVGIVLFAPGCTYPAHAHSGISESYICLSGAVSENHQGVYGPGSMIFNQPGHTHRITVSDWEPALLAYAWSGSAEALRQHNFAFSRRRRA